MTRNTEISRAVRRALVMSAVAATSATSLPAQAQSSEEATQTVTVTGTRIRRIEVETSSPVFVLDRSSIEQTGSVTLGQLLQQTPIVAGAATNPQVNNGGGAGASTISLRGMTEERTLILLNGRRVISDDGEVDVNQIPINLIERVEILKDGASAIYGSDAIGGVVNFITRKDFDGFEISAMRGESERSDAGLDNYQLTMGTRSDTGGFMFGATFNQRDPVSSADRPFSKDPFALYNGQEIVLGSSRTDSGFYRVPRATALAGGADLSAADCAGASAEVVVTKKDDGAGNSIADYRCYIGGGPNNDTYDFQDVNVVVTPQKRYGLFVMGDHDLGGDMSAFVEGTYSFTNSSFQIAPEPFDGRPSQANIPALASNLFNPFGVNITDVRKRLVEFGNRTGEFESQSFLINTGFQGALPRDWRWQAVYTWGQLRQESEQIGEIYSPALAAALGPSFRDPVTGAATCGTPSAPVAGCFPVNIFSTPTTAQEIADQNLAIGNLVPRRHGLTRQDLQIISLNVDGNVFELPAGELGVALGFEYREEFRKDEPDFLAQTEQLSGGIESRAEGGFDVKELYAEFSLPILKDKPFAQRLSLDAGVRYSDYNTFGNTTNAKVGLDWRPVSGFLVRGTYADVFRAPTVGDLFQGIQESADTFNDPCNGLTSPVGANANIDAACQNVARDGSFSQSDSQLNALIGGNADLQPEQGNVITYGLAWTPEALNNKLFTAIDFWKISLDDAISSRGTQTILNQCFTQGLFCTEFSREASGDVFSLTDLQENVGALDTNGIDFAVQYTFDETSLGRFRTRLDATWLDKWDNERLAGDPTTTAHAAGMFLEQSAGGDGHFAKWRGLASVDWSYIDVGATVRARYIGKVTELAPDGALGPVPRDIGDQVILDLQASYKTPWDVDVALGIDNVTDELAPLIYSGFNGTTDVRTYDGIGRFFYLRLNFHK